MGTARAVTAIATDDDDLFEQIGAFLAAQGLSPDPANYAFAHAMLTRDDAEARAMLARLTGDGVRLSHREIETMGAAVVGGPGLAATQRAADAREEAADRLATETRRHAEAIAAMARTIRDDTHSFGRDLAASAAAVAGQPDDVARLTRSMIARAASAEARLAQATDEADALRAELAEAQVDARRDPLTGLANRRALAEAFAALAPAGGHCIALCDVDRFKRLNDRFGHIVGDRMLEAIARLLSNGCGDRLVTRQGGEEFAVLFADTAVAEALALLDAARADLAGRRFRDRDTDAAIGQVTFSAGLVAIGGGEALDEALIRADRLLYAAKDQGRNLVVVG